MKYLITGGAGFIGSHLVDKLIKDGNDVVVIDNLSTGKRENLNSKSIFYEVDIQSSEISEIFEKEKPEKVFHFAAQIDIRKSVEEPMFSAKTNILGTLNILENCKKSGVKKVIFSSTGGAIYGEAKTIPTPENYTCMPLSPYGIEKLMVEYYLNFYKKEYDLAHLILRFANVYGPRQNSKGEAGVISIFCDKLLSGEQPVINGDGKQTRDFVFIDDVVGAIVLAVEKEGGEEIFNIGTGEETDVNIIFQKIKELLNIVKNEVHGPEKEGEQKRSCLDFTKAKKVLGWEPQHNIDEGLKTTVKWFKDEHSKQKN